MNIEYTEQGKKLIAELVAGGKKIQFTKAKTNKQETPISKVEIIDGNTISIDIVFENMNLKEPYYIDSVDLYVNEETDGEFIFVRITPDEPDFMPAFYDNNANSINYKVKLMINNTENVEIVVNPSGFVTIKELEEILSKIEFQPSGGVKFDYDIPYFTDKTNYLILRANEDDFYEFKAIFRELKRLIITDDNQLYFFDGSDFRLLGGRTDLTEVLNQINNLNNRISDLENNVNEDLNSKLEIIKNSVNDNFENVFSKLKDIESIPYIEEITDDIPYSLILRIDKDNKDGLGNVLQGTQRIVIEEDTKKINLFNGEEYVLLSGGSAALNGIPFLESTKSYTDDSIENTSTPLIFRTDNPQVITETLESEHLIIDENTNHLYLYDKKNLREISGGANSDTPSFSPGSSSEIKPDLQYIVPVMNSNEQEGYKISASSIDSNTYQPYYALSRKKSKNNYWCSASGESNSWFKIELPAPQIVNSIGLMAISKGGAIQIQNLIVKGSNNDTDYDILLEKEFNPYGIETYSIFDINNNNSYKFYKIETTNVRNNATNVFGRFNSVDLLNVDISAYNNSSIISTDLNYTKQKLIELKLKNKLIINNSKMYYFDGENINQV